MTARPVPSWRRALVQEAGFKLVAVKDVRRLPGLEPSELLRRPNTQQLTRADESGAREEFLRVPVELLSKRADGLREGGAGTEPRTMTTCTVISRARTKNEKERPGRAWWSGGLTSAAPLGSSRAPSNSESSCR